MLEIVAESKHLKKTYLDNNGMLLHSVHDNYFNPEHPAERILQLGSNYCVLVCNVNFGYFWTDGYKLFNLIALSF